jgi:hypothetical protein
MEQLEPSVLAFAARRDLNPNERPGQIRQMLLEGLCPVRQRFFGQFPRDGQVKPELAKDVGMPHRFGQASCRRFRPALRRRRSSASPGGARKASRSRTQAYATRFNPSMAPCGVSARNRPSCVNLNPSLAAGASELANADAAISRPKGVCPSFSRKGGFSVPRNPYLRGVIVMLSKPGMSCCGASHPPQNAPAKPSRADLCQWPSDGMQ